MKSEPAFPCTTKRNTSSDPLATRREFPHPGMTLRDYFAGQALPSLLARHRADIAWTEVAPIAYSVADAMLIEREKSR